MQLNYSELKKKKVVNLIDGKELGKVVDLIFTFPHGNLLAFVVSKKMLLPSDEFLVNISCVEKIGDDAILVKLKNEEISSCESCISCDDDEIE